MQSLPYLRGRIASLSELHDLVRALRTLAGTHAREAQEALPATAAYLVTVEDATMRIAGLLPDEQNAGVPDQPTTDVLLVLMSEHGFVGAHNEKLLAHASDIRGASEQLVVVGRRGEMAAAEAGLTPDATFSMTTHVGGVASLAREISDAMTWASGLRIVFPRHRQGADIEYAAMPVLPIDDRSGAFRRQGPDPICQIAPAELLRLLTAEYLFAALAEALMHALTCENAARLRAMDVANRNVEDKLSALRQQERTASQEAITEEILDIITGAEAVLTASTRSD